MASPNANPFTPKNNAKKRCASFSCKKCKTTFAQDQDFIQTIPQVAIANTVQCLVRNISNVTFGSNLRQSDGRLIGNNPMIHADLTHIYCASCQTFVGWRIARQYKPHPIIHEGQYIVLLGIGGAVSSMNKKSDYA